MSLLLIKPEFDIWEPGEHTGTLEINWLSLGNSCSRYRENTNLEQEVKVKEFFLKFLTEEIAPISDKIGIRGIGLIWVLTLQTWGASFAKKITSRCFELGLIVERVGRNTVIKILPPLTIELSHCKRVVQSYKKLLTAKIKLFTNYPNSNFLSGER